MSRDIVSNDNKRKRKAQHCDVEGMGEVICDYEQHGATIVSNRVTIPEANKHLNLVGKALCRKHYNKLIVNAKKSTEGSVCSHPKHEIYESTARPGKKETKVRKMPERLVKYFKLPHTALMCRHCLYKSDNDPEYVDSPNYLLPIEKLSKVSHMFYVVISSTQSLNFRNSNPHTMTYVQSLMKRGWVCQQLYIYHWILTAH